ncbi:hypothetical protein AHiyo4_49360 [Arthrobacter sp. Hiyo4]|nr:hypothetical protein AHiyo4_49360 [Arthrobacter sp. Hiyo4]
MTTEPAAVTPATHGLRLVLGADEAGVDYNNRILADLQADPRISEIIDIGVNRSDARRTSSGVTRMWASRRES